MLERAEIGLWAVADGAGGHQRGDYASGRIMAALNEGSIRRRPAFYSLPRTLKTVSQKLTLSSG